MEKEELYPEGTVQQTDDFAFRQKIKKIVGENVEQIIKDETIDAFKELGYEEKDGYLFVIAAGGKDNEEKEIGKGTAEGKLNVTVSIPKMLNMGAVKPVSYMQKVTTFGGKRIVSEIYLEIKQKNVHIEYKNTEAAAFHQSSEKDTYAPQELSKSGTISNIDNEASFKKDFKKFFQPIAQAEASYLIGTKIAVDDKTEKDMNDSIVKENKYNMKLTDLFSSSFEEVGDKIDNLVKEAFVTGDSPSSFEDDDKTDGAKTPDTPTGEPTDKKLVIGSEEESENPLEEITTSGPGIGGATEPSGFKYPTPYGFSKDGKTPDLKANKDYTPVNEAVKDTTYGQMRTPRAHLTRQNDGSYKVISEGSFPYTEKVEMEPGTLNMPKGMNHPYAMGMHGTELNSKEELDKTGHGDLNAIVKEIEKTTDKEQMLKRKFSSLKENEEKGINKRYIITEKMSKEEESKRWKTLYENDCFCNVKDTKDVVSGEQYESMANKEFEANNKSLESSLSNTPYSGEEKGYLDVPKARGSMIIFRLSESDVRRNQMYLIDHFTNKLVLNPLFKPQV